MVRAFCVSFVVLVLGVGSRGYGQQVADPNFNVMVAAPAYTDRHPLVLFDEAHNNFHTAGARYKPFADLITSDGYRITANRQKFTREMLQGYDVLAIVSAMGAPRMNSPEAAKPAFTSAECDAVRDWVKGGGALLLITDHHPVSEAVEELASRFGVGVGKGVTSDPMNTTPENAAQLVFAAEKGLLGDHPVIQGRNASERVSRVMTFTGQSLQGPAAGTPLLKLATTAVDRPLGAGGGQEASAAGRTQGVAFNSGSGRVIILGEAGMLSAQLAGPTKRPMGMNYPGTDNRQFALNAMHWLSRLTGGGETRLASATPASPATAMPANAPPPAATTPAPSAAAPAPAPAPVASAPRQPGAPGHPMTTAEIIAESEPSIALVKGRSSFGTGFLVRPGVVMTNSHVIADETLSSLEISFPSAEETKRGPYAAELLYEDPKRDLALLGVKTELPPVRIASAYAFRKGDDVTVIGNPGIGGEIVLENAVSRGILSTKTTLAGENFYQLSIAINPGNSGGPVFDSTGQVIGVVTLKSTKQESLAFSIPVEELSAALDKYASQSAIGAEHARSKHRMSTVFMSVTESGAVYLMATILKRALATPAGRADGSIVGAFEKLKAVIAEIEKNALPSLTPEINSLKKDRFAPPLYRDKLVQLADSLNKLKAVYAGRATTKNGGDPLIPARDTFRRLANDLSKSLQIEIPSNLTVAFDIPLTSPTTVNVPSSTNASRPGVRVRNGSSRRR